MTNKKPTAELKCFKPYTPSRNGNMMLMSWLEIERANISFDIYFKKDEVERRLAELEAALRSANEWAAQGNFSNPRSMREALEGVLEITEQALQPKEIN